jgi:trehalose synthase
MPTIFLRPRRLDDYGGTVGPNVLTMLRRLAAPLAGLRVLHLSAGPFGSAVAETLSALVPLQRDLGLQADWHLLRGDAPRVWSALYEGLSGFAVRWGERERRAWYAYAERHASAVAPDYDVVVAHDPQAIALASVLPRIADQPRWIWHCHLDTRGALPQVWEDIQQALQPYVAALFPSPSLVRADLPVAHVAVGRPAIDPCSPRNVELPAAEVAALLGRLGVDPDRPAIGQFAPIDHRYAPIAVLGAYWIARREVPGLQVLLVENTAAVSIGARRDLDQVADAAGGDPDVHILTTHAGLSPAELNALQRKVAVALELAVPRGFGWGLAECQWKSRPAVVGRHGQLAEQIGYQSPEDMSLSGKSGIVAEGAPAAAAAVVRLLNDRVLSDMLGRRGRDQIARNYLITGLLGDYLRLFRRVTDNSAD